MFVNVINVHKANAVDWEHLKSIANSVAYSISIVESFA